MKWLNKPESKRATDFMEANGLFPADLRTLVAVLDCGKDGCTSSEVSLASGLAYGTTHNSLRRLTDAGVVKRVTGPTGRGPGRPAYVHSTSAAMIRRTMRAGAAR